MSYSSFYELSEGVHKAWNKQGRLCYLVLGLIAVIVLIPHFVIWSVHYGTYVSTPCYRNATGGPRLVYEEPLTSGSYAHTILCLWAVVICLFDILEYAQITWGFAGRKYVSYDYFSSWKMWTSCSWKWWQAFLFLAVAGTILGLMGLGKIVLAFAMELKDDCLSYMNIYVAYCGLEIFHVCLDIFIRMIMLTEMFKIRELWDCTVFEELNNDKIITYENPNIPRSKHLAEVIFRKNLLHYHEKGRAAQHLMHPFKIWFLTPWLVYSVETSLNPNTLLSPWTESDSTIEDITKWFHIINVVLKTYQLILQYIFAVKINEYHRNYYLEMKRSVLFKFEKFWTFENEQFKQEYLAEVSQLIACVEFKDSFNFYPTFLGLNPRIAVDGPFYVFVLLLGVIMNSFDSVSNGFTS